MAAKTRRAPNAPILVSTGRHGLPWRKTINKTIYIRQVSVLFVSDDREHIGVDIGRYSRQNPAILCVCVDMVGFASSVLIALSKLEGIAAIVKHGCLANDAYSSYDAYR